MENRNLLKIKIEVEASPQLQEFLKTAIKVGKTIIQVGQRVIPILMTLQATLGELPHQPQLPQLPPKHQEE
jgi:hypothetical protein